MLASRTLTNIDLRNRLGHAAPGEEIVYHIGMLASDRIRGMNFPVVHGVACAAREAFDAGKVHLAQRRVMPGIYEYLAIVR